MTHPKTTLLILYITLASHSIVNAQSERDALKDYAAEDRSTLESIFAIKSPDSVDQYFNRLPAPDLIVRIVYYSHRLELRSDNAAEIGLLNTLPQSRVEVAYMYEMTQEPLGGNSGNQKTNAMYYGYFQKVTDALLKHRTYVQRYLRFACLLEGENAEAFELCCCTLINRDCDWFFKSLSKANPHVQSSVLDYLSTPASLEECIRPNQSKIPTQYLMQLMENQKK